MTIKKALPAILTIVMMTSLTISVKALVPTEPHNANAMWFEPSTTELNITETSIGYKFNVTVWVNSSLQTKGWQFWLLYASAYINATRTEYTAGSKSEFFKDITTMPVTPILRSFNATHNRLDYGEAWLMGPYRSQGYGSLCWIEFEVVALPGIAVDIPLDIKWAYDLEPPQTYLLYSDGSKRPLNVHNGLVRFVTGLVDTVPPSITVLSPENKTYRTSSVPLTYTVNERTSWTGYSLDDRANVTISGNITLTDLSEGSHNIMVFANDTSRNMGFSPRVYFNISLAYLAEDLNSDGRVNIEDIVVAAEHLGSYPGHSRWNPAADLNGDDYIGIDDVTIVAMAFGKT